MGQILRVSAVFHILLHLNKEILSDNIDVVISECAIMAGIHFVELCGQHVTSMEGREEIDEEIKQLEVHVHTM